MSIIEQAARRLEELRRSGIDVPAPGASGEVTSGRVVPMLAGAGAAAQSAHQAGAQASRLVEIDLAKLEANGFVAPNAPRSRLADEIRTLKRPLLANVRGESAAPIQRANCIMVTSAVPGEGKTFTSINLALSMAMEIDSRVLLIDGDTIRPLVLQRMGLPPTDKGLLDKLNNPQIPLSDLILRTNIDKLSLLPAGRVDLRATELLASESMRDIIGELASRYADRIVIFDAPPLMAAPETRILAEHVGQIVVVIEAQRTHRQTVVDALALLESCPVVMTMLNKVRVPMKHSYGYGQGEHA